MRGSSAFDSPDMNKIPRVVLLVFFGYLATGCQELGTVFPAQPEVIVPPGVISTQTADEVAKRVLDEIAANERKLGRALVPARIIKIQLLREGETFWTNRLDGTNPNKMGLGLSPGDGAGWVVEAVGTFLSFERENPQALSAMGTHGFRLYADGGGAGFTYYPCWTLRPAPASELEGNCR